MNALKDLHIKPQAPKGDVKTGKLELYRSKEDKIKKVNNDNQLLAICIIA